MINDNFISMNESELFEWWYISCADYGLTPIDFRAHTEVLNALQCQYLNYRSYSLRMGRVIELSEREYIAHGLRQTLEASATYETMAA